MISSSDLGWLAGIIDLKGRVQYRRRTNASSRQMTLAIDSKNYAVIHKLSALIGTKPNMRPARPPREWMQRPCTEHCPEKQVAHQHAQGPEMTGAMPQMGRWGVSGAAMAVVLYNVIPYLLEWDTWTTYMQEAIEGTALDSRGSTATIASLRRLRDLGWDLPPTFEEAIREREETATAVQ